MKKIDQVQQRALELLENLENCVRPTLEINTKDGSVSIDRNTFNFTYEGKFGQSVSRMMISHNAMNDLTKKFLILAANMEAYSMKVAGIVIY